MIIPCHRDEDLAEAIEQYAEALRTHAHELGNHGLNEDDFYASGLLRGAIEHIRGGYSAGINQKREFINQVLNHMEDQGFIAGWDPTEQARRYDYRIRLNSGRIAAIAGKGCMDGNNTTLFERPIDADEFVIWSICTNRGADIGKNVRSGIHTRLGVDIILRKQAVDGVIVWDWACGTSARPCPKVASDDERRTILGSSRLPPPCIYVLPARPPDVESYPDARAQILDEVEILTAFQECFGGQAAEVNFVDFSLESRNGHTMRRTTVTRNDEQQLGTEFTRIRRVQ